MKRYQNLDGLRAFSAIGILIMHVLANMPYEYSGIGYRYITNLWYLVYLFFILSAFGMCCGYYERIKQNQISINDFYTKRYLKILPFYALLVIMDVLVSGITKASLSEAFASLTLTYALFPQNITIISVGWTLGVVFAFYLLFPWFVYLIWNKKRAWLTMMISLVMNYLCLNYFFVSNHFIVNSLCYFVAGGLIYLYRNEIECIVRKYQILWIFITMILSLYLLKGDMNTYCTIFIFSLWMFCFMGKDYKWCSSKVIGLISRISFEIYLCHLVIFRLLEKIHITSFMIINPLISYIVMALVTFTGAVIFALCTQKIIQKGILFIQNKGQA